MASAQNMSKAELENMGLEPADLEAILKVTQEEDSLDAQAKRWAEQMQAQTKQAVEASLGDAEKMRRLREEQEERELQEALALSAASPDPEPKLLDDEDSIQRALRESELEAQAAEARRKELMRSEDEGELFQAALRASKVDLGPRGISQAAKIMATGDTGLGQAAAVAKTGSHSGAGSRFSRQNGSRSTSSLRLESSFLQHAGAAAAAGATSKAPEAPVPAGGEDGAAAPPGRASNRGAAATGNASGSLRGAGISLAAGAGQRAAAAGCPAPKSLGRASVRSSSASGVGDAAVGTRNSSAAGHARQAR